MAHVMLPSIMNVLYFYLVMCIVQYGCLKQFLFSCFPGMLLRYVLNDSEMVPVAPIITGNTPVPHSL